MNFSQQASYDEIPRRSPPFLRMVTTDLSPLAETIEVSEDLIGGNYDNQSDISGTPSDQRNGKNHCIRNLVS